MEVIGISFEDFKVIVGSIYKFPEINGKFVDESPDFTDRLLYKWLAETSYTYFCVEYDSSLQSWIVDRGRGIKGHGITLAQAVKDELIINGYEPIKFSFQEFQTILIAQWPETEKTGLFIDDTNNTDPGRFLYSWSNFPRYGYKWNGSTLVEYDSAALNRWKLTTGTKQKCGQTLRQAIDNGFYSN